MQVRLEKINHVKRQRRFYVMQVTRTLFDEWCLVREWGRIGNAGGQRRTDYLDTEDEALSALALLKGTKSRRGYATIPVQLELF